jgi:hypothetical protein
VEEMTVETMTVHKALAELKVLDARIQKAMRSAPFVVANKHSNTKIEGVPVSEYSNSMKSAYQQCRDLINRRNAIKRAVISSNAVAKIVVAGEEYTVAEAIDMKQAGVDLYRTLRDKMVMDNTTARMKATQNNGDSLERRADDHVKVLFGNSDMKDATEEVKKAREEFIKAQTYELLDPLGIVGEMEALDKLINEFLVDVDSQLSVSNAITTIEIQY